MNELEITINNILKSDEELYPENTSLILSKCEKLIDVNFMILCDDTLKINIHIEYNSFVINVSVLSRKSYKEYRLSINENEQDKIKKIINNFTLSEIMVKFKGYKKEDLMGG